MNLFEKLSTIQGELKAPKGQFNSFGKYAYRSCEDILEALKPLLVKYKAAVTLSDEIVLIGDRYYIKATAKIIDAETGEFLTTHALAREEDTKKGMDSSQLTGSTSSYARKYALNGLFSIDDNKDSDFTNKHGQDTPTINKSSDGFGTLTFNSTSSQGQKNDYVINEKQLKRLIAIGSKAGVTYETIKAQVQKEFGVDPKELKKTQYDNICDRLEKKIQ